MVDYSALLFDPVYEAIGVPAVIGTAGITVIDDTRRKPLPISSAVTAASFAEVRSVGPGAYARVYELAAKGITREVWVGATLTFNGRTWTVRSYELHGSPNGEDMGEVLLLLKAQAYDGNGDGGDVELSSSGVSSRSISGGAI